MSQFLYPILILVGTMVLSGLICSLIFKRFPKEIYNFLLGLSMLGGAYLWFAPMSMGFYSFFR